MTRPGEDAAIRTMIATRVLPRYAVAVGAVAVSTVLTFAMAPFLERGLLALYFAAVMASAFYGGLGPGLLATVLSVLATEFFFMHPKYSFAVHSADDVAAIVVFSLVAVLISLLNTANQRAKRALEESNEKLEDRVKERTAWLSLVYDITGAANETETVEQAYRFVLRRIGQDGFWRYGQVYLPSREDPDLLAPAHFYLAEDNERLLRLRAAAAYSRVKKGEGGVGRVWAGGGVEWASDLRADPGYADSSAAAAGMRTVVVFPVLVERKAVAVFECFSETSVERDLNLVHLMGAVGIELGLVVHRKQLQEEYAEAVWKQQRQTAQELHDDLGQRLTGLGLLSQSLSDQLKETDQGKPAKRLRDGLEEALQQIRGLVKGVFPVELDSEGLMAALAQLAAGMGADSGISCRFECPTRVLVPDNRLAMHLYRIAQEAVTNALKHGRPRLIVIRLEETPGEVRLSISDDGAGMPPPSERKEGAGLRIMRYRAAAIAATLKIESNPGGGTLVRCEAPRSETKEPEAARGK